jgi:3-deoxy-manno-octulosonate cytidylyltransferase (CMP-KDO synthetase)
LGFGVVIPARHGSTRLPGKPLRSIGGRPMIQHVFERAVESGAESVTVATDDEHIADVARGFGATVCMTSAAHRSGTERLGEVMQRLAVPDAAIVVNVQGDEPLIPPALIAQVAADLQGCPAAAVSTLWTPVTSAEELFSPSMVKVVTDRDDFALYFSRAPIPWARDAFPLAAGALPHAAAYRRHVGLYAYRAGFLRIYAALPCSPLEELEVLEQLRVLWAGGRIHVARAGESCPPGVDTEEDLLRVEALLDERYGLA